MMVKFKSFGPLRRILGDQIIDLEVSEGATVRDVIEALVDIHGDDIRKLICDGNRISGNLILMLNMKDVNNLQGEDTMVSEGDTVTVLPHVQGG